MLVETAARTSTVNRKRDKRSSSLFRTRRFILSHVAFAVRAENVFFKDIVVFEKALKSGTATVRSEIDDVPTKSERAGCNGTHKYNAVNDNGCTFVGSRSAIRSDLQLLIDELSEIS